MIKGKPTYISLFSSAGVGCYGFKLNNFECIATNELIERRLNVQRINKKCKYESGYISGDIKNEETKQTEFDKDVVTKLIEKVIVNSREDITFIFKDGTEVRAS